METSVRAYVWCALNPSPAVRKHVDEWVDEFADVWRFGGTVGSQPRTSLAQRTPSRAVDARTRAQYGEERAMRGKRSVTNISTCRDGCNTH